MKRIFDLIFSLTILVFFLPLGILISICIKLTSKGPVFYAQERVGRSGKTFKLLKFRTMRPNADRSGKLTVGMKDPRITAVGYFLRKYKLDEFPQFINVLLGQMSVVGPRPEVREYVDLYPQEDLVLLELKPGITDYASLHYYNENEILGRAENPEKVYRETIMPEKLRLNHLYLKRAGLITDLKIIWATFMRTFKRPA